MPADISLLTLFPEYFSGPLGSSLMGRAQKQGLLRIQCVALRDFGEGQYKAVDDRPYGGGPGMILTAPVLERALQSTQPQDADLKCLEASVLAWKTNQTLPPESEPWVVFLSPQGEKLTAEFSRSFCVNTLQRRPVVVICGHYEGVDERFLDSFVHQEISVGDFVLTGGEPAALVLLDCLSRFISGVVGDPSSVESDTFESGPDMVPGGLKYPLYTRPQNWRGQEVPSVLSSGNHAEVSRWRLEQSRDRTSKRRPDLKR